MLRQTLASGALSSIGKRMYGVGLAISNTVSVSFCSTTVIFACGLFWQLARANSKPVQANPFLKINVLMIHGFILCRN